MSFSRIHFPAGFRNGRAASRKPAALVRLFSSVLILSGAGLALLSGGCATGDPYFMDVDSEANVYVAPHPVAIHKVAVLPFKAPTELIGTSVSDMFVTEMLRAGRYELVERSQMAKVLGESELALSGLSESRAAEVGQMAGADGVIVGTVDEYSTIAYRGKTYPVVGISIRLIDCESGKVLWSCDLAKRSRDRRLSLPKHARNTVHEITAGLVQHWRVQKTVPRRERPRASARARENLAAPVGYTAAQPAEPPPVPENFSLSDMGLREVEITWKESDGNPARYRIERALTEEGPFKTVARVPYRKMRYVDQGRRNKPLCDGKVYYYRLVAEAAGGLTSKPSRTRESMTAPPPDPPAEVRVEAPSPRAVHLSWAPSDSEGVTEYLVERASAEAPKTFEERATVGETNFLDGGTARSDLKDSADYLYRVTAINRVGAVGSPSKSVAVTTRPPPAPIAGLAAQTRQVRCVPLSWAPAPEKDVVAYRVYRADEPGADFLPIARVEGRETPNYLDGGDDPGNLEDEHTYYYCLTAVNDVTAESKPCKPAHATTRGAPPPVKAVAAESKRPREVPLSWGVSPDEKVIGYVVARARGDSDAFVEIATVEGLDTIRYTDRGEKARKWFGGHSSGLGRLEDGAVYRYRVCAFNTARVRSQWSKPVEATTKPAPQPPAALVATTNKPHAITLRWADNPESDIAAYVVQASSNGRSFHEVARVAPEPNDALEASVAGLRDGEQRFLRVKAVDQDTLESAWSEPVEGRAKPPPDAPEKLRADSDGAGIKLSWKSPPQPDIQQYCIFKKTLLGCTEIGTTEEPVFRLDGASVGKGIRIQISAIDKDGLESARSAPLEVRP